MEKLCMNKYLDFYKFYLNTSDVGYRGCFMISSLQCHSLDAFTLCVCVCAMYLTWGPHVWGPHVVFYGDHMSDKEIWSFFLIIIFF